jgi:hypothetical protein
VQKIACLPALFIVICAAAALPAAAQPKDAQFSVEGPNYVAQAVGRGDSEAQAQNEALRAAIGVIMEALNKDRLYTELFLKNPPVSMNWKKLSAEQGLRLWTVRIALTVDDESLRILQNGAYLSTVSNLLDDAEEGFLEAEKSVVAARTAESDGQLGRAMSLYWQARDAAESGLALISSIGDAAIFSSQTKKKAPELREVLDALRASAVSGYDRIRAAERGLAEDESLSSALAALAAIDAEVAAIEDWAESIGPRASAVEGSPRAELMAFGDELASRLRSLSDSRLALARVEPLVPKSKELVRVRLDVNRKRIERTERYLKSTKAAVDREIRDPAIARAKRAQNLRWAFLHEPSGALALRLYSPFGLDPSAKDIAFMDTGRFEFGLRSEGAFGGDKGFWISSSLFKDDAVLALPSGAGGLAKNTGYSQNLDLGFYGRGLFGAGISWDWLRRVDGESVEKRLALRALAGGMDEGAKRAAWLMALSWELPYELNSFELANYLNFGLDGLLRLGNAVELGAGLSYRVRESVGYGYDASLRYNAGAGLRLPKPFLWGLEFAGHAAKPLGGGSSIAASYIRMFLEYSL